MIALKWEISGLFVYSWIALIVFKWSSNGQHLGWPMIYWVPIRIRSLIRSSVIQTPWPGRQLLRWLYMVWKDEMPRHEWTLQISFCGRWFLVHKFYSLSSKVLLNNHDLKAKTNVIFKWSLYNYCIVCTNFHYLVTREFFFLQTTTHMLVLPVIITVRHSYSKHPHHLHQKDFHSPQK